jgi:hypothetical protein
LDGRAIAASVVREKPVPAEFWGAFARYWLTRHQRSVQLAWELALGEVPASARAAWSSEFPVALFRRRVNSLPESLVVLSREGPKAWADKCEQPIFRDYETLQSNQLWCSDHHQMDLWVWDDRTNKQYRPWLTVWSDVRSRKVMAWSLELEAPNGERVLCTWSDAVMDWGLPDAVYVDNGKDYRCQIFTGGRARESRHRLNLDEQRVSSVLAELEVGAHFALPYNARSKPVERWFAFLEDRFGKLWDSYCGNQPNADKRPELCKQLLDEPERLPRLEAVREALAGFVEWFNASWQHSGHGMHGRTPDQVYRAHNHTVRLRPSEEQLKLCLMPSELLTVSRGCVRLTVAGVGRWYTDEAGLLRAMPPATRLRVRYNPRSLGRVWLFDETDRFLCYAVEQSRVGWDYTSDDLRQAKARQSRNRRALRAAAEAERDMLSNPDPLDAVLQQRAGYAAGHEQRRTGTDDTPLPDLNSRISDLRPKRLRLTSDGPKTESGEEGLSTARETSPGPSLARRDTSWIDSIGDVQHVVSDDDTDWKDGI